jgi:DNA-binding SARP family transcriptional activator
VRDLDEWARRAIAPVTGSEEVAVPDARLLGELLPGWYDDWVLLERERLRHLRMQALEAVAARLASLGRHCEALQAAHAVVRAEPMRESAHRTVVSVHLSEGNVAEAVRAYEFFRTMLEDELGVPPTEQMTRLVQHIPWVRRALAVRGPGCPRDREQVRGGDLPGARATSGLAPRY